MKWLMLVAAVASGQTLVVHADRMLDGKGRVVRNGTVTIEGRRSLRSAGSESRLRSQGHDADAGVD